MAVTCLYSSQAQTRPCRIEPFKPPVKATHGLSDKLGNDGLKASTGDRPTYSLISRCFSGFWQQVYPPAHILCVNNGPLCNNNNY